MACSPAAIVIVAIIRPLITPGLPSTQREGPQETYQKSTNMCPPSHAPSSRMGGERPNATQEVGQKPEPEEEHRWELNRLQEDKYRHQREHSSIGKEQQIGTHDASNGATRAHCWDA